MPEVNRVILSLDGYCIETSAKKRLEELIRLSIENGIESINTSEIEFLQDFIKNTDFKRIRAENPALDGRKKVKVALELQKDGGYSIRILPSNFNP